MPNNYTEAEQYGELGIIALESCKDLGDKIDARLRYEKMMKGDICPPTYLISTSEIRFADGEGKVRLNETVRGKDVYLLCDIGNYGCTYEMFGMTVPKGPDEHFQDIKRTLSAIGGRSKRTTVIMPKLYAARQDRRRARESLDCAIALKELENMGVKDILTFDVHDSRIQNSVPLSSFENLYATYDIVKELMTDEPDVIKDKDSLLVIAPDSGAMDRAIYYSNVLGIDVGMFYKRRDFSTFVKGQHPIVQHEYMGRPVEGKNILIIDDIIASGSSMFDLFEELKRRKAGKIFVAATFAQFVKGINKFDQYYEDGFFDRIYATNLTYLPEKTRQAEWLKVVDMSSYISNMITLLHHGRSIEPLLDSTDNLKELINQNRMT